MENSSYPTDDRRDYDDRQTNHEEDGSGQRGFRPRRPYNQGGYGQRGNGPRRPYNSEGSHYSSDDGGSRRSYNQNGYGKPRNGYGSGQHRPYNSEGSHRPYNSDEGGYGSHSEGYGGQRGSAQRRPYNSDGQRRPHEGSRRPYNSEEGGFRKPYNSEDGGSRRPYNSENGGSRRPYNRNGYGKPRSSAPQHNDYGSGPRRNYVEEGQGTYGRPRNDRAHPHNDGSAPRKGGLRPRKNSGPKPGSGIYKMLSRKPLVDEKRYSDNDMVKLPIKEEVRLNKFIADSGICSRREADNFILAGVVTVNGTVVTELGVKVNKFNDDVRFNGERLKGEAKVYIVMNKPRGYVTTTNDPHADKTVMDLLKSCTARVTPVGRLDKNTTGVLMFTNDGEIAEKLTHPAYNKKKIYEVTLTSDLSQEDYEKILAGIQLSDGVVAADELEYVDENNRKKLGIEIHSGKNRLVRRIFESLGYTVRSLDRVYFAGLTKKGVKRGAWRYLSEAEVNILKMGAYN